MNEKFKEKIEKYKGDFGLNDSNTPLIIITEILASIDSHLEEIANKMYE